MPTRYLKVSGDNATPLPYKKRVDSTHSLDLSDSDYERCVSPAHFNVVAGEPVVKSQAEYDAEIAANAELYRVAALEQEAQAYQDSIMSSNEAAAIMGARAAGIALKPKAQANSDWVDAVWAIYYAKLADANNTQLFSEAGVKPYPFAEVMAE